VTSKGATRGRAKRAEAPSLAKSKFKKKHKISDNFDFLCLVILGKKVKNHEHKSKQPQSMQDPESSERKCKTK